MPLPTVTFEATRPSGSVPGEEFWLLPPQSLAPGNDLWQGSPFDEWGNWDEEKIAARLLPQPVGGRAVCVKVSPAGRLYARVYEEPISLAQLAEGCVLCPGSVPLAEPAAPLPPLPGAVLNATVLEATVDHPRHLTGLAYFDGSENHILESLDPASLAEFDRLCPGFCLRWTEDGSLLIRRIPDSSPAARLTLKWDFDPSIRAAGPGSDAHRHPGSLLRPRCRKAAPAGGREVRYVAHPLLPAGKSGFLSAVG